MACACTGNCHRYGSCYPPLNVFMPYRQPNPLLTTISPAMPMTPMIAADLYGEAE